MKKIMWIGGSHPRHLYYANEIHYHFPLHAAIIESRENIIPLPPSDLEVQDQENFIRHFQTRYEAEMKYFSTQHAPQCPILEVSEDRLNSKESADFVKKYQPDLVLIFGCGLVKSPLYDALPRDAINLHLGLSPRYRGSATLFWPFYFLEPNHAGSTFHYIVSEPDAGEIVHQLVPKLEMDDGIHDVACKTVVDSAKAAVELLQIYEAKGGWETHRQIATGKNFLSDDFIPQHLRMIYQAFNDDIVKQYLLGYLKPKPVKLYKQFT